MKLLYLPGRDPNSAGDFQEVCMLHGLRSIMGEDCIDWPKKKILYADFSDSPKDELHGAGFTLYTEPIQDISNRDHSRVDFVLYGVTDSYNVTDYPEINAITPNVWYLDGHDHQRITKKPCFKREMFLEEDGVYPTGFGIPHHQIRSLNFTKKIQIIQKTAPPYAVFGPQILGGDTRQLYCFSDEKDYYKDMSQSWFGLTCKKGGWDSLRHYEILASGACLLFRDYDKKPPLCAPQNLPCFSYSTLEELESIINRLLINDKPTDEYYDMILRQREWLIKYGTTEARAMQALLTILSNRGR